MNPDIGYQTVEPEKDTEQKILAAAARVFMLKGKDGASMQDIADEAGINRTLLHYYFRSKDKLFEKIFQNTINELFPAIALIFISDKPFFDKLEMVTIKFIDLLKKYPFLPIFMFQEITLNPDRLLGRLNDSGFYPQKVINQIQTELREITGEELDPRHIIANFLGTLIFPFVAKPLFINIAFAGNEEQYQVFLEERKQLVPEFVKKALYGFRQQKNNNLEEPV